MNEQPDLLPDDSGPTETFVRFEDLDAFYAKCRADHTRCIIQTLDRKRGGYACVVVSDKGCRACTGMMASTAASEQRSQSH